MRWYDYKKQNSLENSDVPIKVYVVFYQGHKYWYI